jgi:hypothetical protein
MSDDDAKFDFKLIGLFHRYELCEHADGTFQRSP